MQETIQTLLRKLPGYQGYEAQEFRREADRALRMHLAQQYRSEQQALIQLAQRMVAAGRLDLAEPLTRINQVLERFVARLETAPYGYAGWFDSITIDDTDLDQIYWFDAKLADSIPLLRERITYVETQLNAGEGVAEALASLRSFADDLHRQFDARQEFVAAGKRPAQEGQG